MGVVAKSLCVIAVVAIGGNVAVSNAFATTAGDGSREVSAQRRTNVTIHPSRSSPGPNATRHCDAWLEKEYRPSGTVVVPRMRCVWR